MDIPRNIATSLLSQAPSELKAAQESVEMMLGHEVFTDLLVVFDI